MTWNKWYQSRINDVDIRMMQIYSQCYDKHVNHIIRHNLYIRLLIDVLCANWDAFKLTPDLWLVSRQLSNYQKTYQLIKTTYQQIYQLSKHVIKKLIKKFCFSSSITAFASFQKKKTDLCLGLWVLATQKLRIFLRTFRATYFCGRWQRSQNRCVFMVFIYKLIH